MRKRFSVWPFAIAIVTAIVAAVVSISLTRSAGQAPHTARRADGTPDFSGVWQANNEAHWDLQAHAARAGAVTQSRGVPLCVCTRACGTGARSRCSRWRSRVDGRGAG